MDWSNLLYLTMGANSAASSAASNAISASQNKKAQRRAYNYARQLQQHQYDLSIQGYKEAPTAQRAGLESAGYNPMLLSQGSSAGVSVAGGTPVGANANDSIDFSGDISNAVSAINSIRQTKATIDNLNANTKKANSESAGIDISNKYIDDKSKAEISNVQASTGKMNAEVDNMKAFQEFEAMRLQLKELGIMKGYESSIYSANKAYNASTYASNVNERNNIRTNNANEVNNIRSTKYKSWNALGFGHSGYYR